MPSSLVCSACNCANAVDSRFCRLCGAALTGAAESASPVATETQNAASNSLANSISASETAAEGDFSSPADIDARRARQLLERAQDLTERGDATGAILACRQSIALAPTLASGYSMLGLLLERTGDAPHAIAAYEKATQLAPDNAPDRENLERLREKNQHQQTANLFHFDDEELFEGTNVVSTPPANAKKSKKEAAPISVTPAAIPTATTAPVASVIAPASEISASEVPATQSPATELPATESLRISAAAPGLPAASLYAVETPVAPAASATPASVAPASATPAPISIAATVAAPVVAAPVAAAPVAAPISVISERRATERRQSLVPVPQERRQSSERRDELTAPRSAARVSPLTLPASGAPSNKWSNLRRRPSYFGRSLPLAGATVLSLGFLVWARSFAIARSISSEALPPVVATGPLATDPIPTDPALAPNPNAPGAPPQLPPVGTNTPQNGGFPISNRPLVPATAPVTAPAAPPASVTPASAPPAGTGNQGTAARPNSNANAAQRPNPAPSTPDFPRSIAPAPIPAPARPQGSSGTGNNGGGLGLPAPVISAPAPASPPVAVLPPGGASPLNPAGAGGRGYVRITQGRVTTSTLPQRPAAQAGADERSAARATGPGQSERAIERLSAAINTDPSDAAFRLQQRGQLFLDRGDYARAADDFQSAISAYNEQIARGEQVASARAGVRTARSGLNLALAGNRR